MSAPIASLLVLLSTPFATSEAPKTPPPASAQQAAPDAAVQPMPEPEVVMYATEWCGFCRKMRTHLDSIGAKWVERDIEKDPVAAQRFVSRFGQSGVPVLEIGKEVVKGYDPQKVNEHLQTLRTERKRTEAAKKPTVDTRR